MRFLSRGPGYRLFLTNDAQAVFTLTRPSAKKAAATGGVPLKRHEKGTFESTALGLRLVGARTSPKVAAADRLPGSSNYFVGRDAAKWRRDVPSYARVDFDEVYPGVDLSYYGTAAGALEYDFAVAPGADPSKIALAVRGARSMAVDAKNGDLVLKTALGPVRWARPVAYQVVNGKRVAAVATAWPWPAATPWPRRTASASRWASTTGRGPS